ncbi:MAG: lipid-binding SYLF domain-containing protein [Cyclobacteriaceae bacterium]|nr:lipid-binding SYLF domain-containing protein [Cyclobacteriaceae bacterium]
MNQYLNNAVLVMICCLFFIPLQAQNTKEKTDISRSQEAIEYFLEEDAKIKKFFDEAYAYVVFPSIGKGGIGLGGAHGNGIIYKEGSPYGRASVTQASIGFQLGGQSFMEIIFFKDQRAFDNFIEGKLKLGASASAVAITEGAAASAAYNDGVAVFTAVKGGLMYEASVGGQKFKYKPFEG